VTVSYRTWARNFWHLYDSLSWNLYKFFCILRSLLFLFFGGTGVWTQSLVLARQAHLQLESLWQPFFVMFFFEIGSLELFA
jgi:hypothetical protein